MLTKQCPAVFATALVPCMTRVAGLVTKKTQPPHPAWLTPACTATAASPPLVPSCRLLGVCGAFPAAADSSLGCCCCDRCLEDRHTRTVSTSASASAATHAASHPHHQHQRQRCHPRCRRHEPVAATAVPLLLLHQQLLTELASPHASILTVAQLRCRPCGGIAWAAAGCKSHRHLGVARHKVLLQALLHVGGQ
ncbi:hypothetical protein COO60DRAFT_266044 [Scenedesmus sp. NREL 46B-D3]|nr:hypothetical protein COO60DRAFT_266044 [Scenedesmus sp. NREL 46B-D3]